MAAWLARRMHRPTIRRLVLWAIFRAMPRAVRRKALARENVVVEWRITGRRDGRQDVRQLVIEEGAACVLRGEPRDADLGLMMDGGTFLLLATGKASGPVMFASGKVELYGDPWLAMRLPRFFAVRLAKLLRPVR
jgi:putative sterol carrier protein